MAAFSWVACEARTGVVIADLPDLSCDRVPVTMGRYESASASLPLPTAPENWERAILEGGSSLVLLRDETPLWGGLVTQAPRTHGDVVSLSLVTAEGYLDRRFVGDVTYTATGQNVIVTDLISRFVADPGGIPLRVQVVTAGDGAARDRTYTDASDQTVYSQLQELMSVAGGPEWTIGWEHQTNPERYTPVLYVGDRLGSAPMNGLTPSVTFDLPGNVLSAEQGRDFTAGKGATRVVATSSGVADARPQSSPQVSADPDRPTFEHRWSPSSSITDVVTLDEHAARKLTDLASGSRPLSVTIDASDDASPIPGRDWTIGDVVGVDLTAPAWPTGLKTTARVYGWSLTLNGTPYSTPLLSLD